MNVWDMKSRRTKMYNEELIREAVDIVIGDDGYKSEEVLEVLKILKDKEEYQNEMATR